MKIAVIGTHGLPMGNLKKLLPRGTSRLIVGTDDSVDFRICKYVISNGLTLKRMVPKSEDYPAVLENIRNIIQEADKVLIFWNGESEKTAYAIRECISIKKDFNVYTTFKKF